MSRSPILIKISNYSFGFGLFVSALSRIPFLSEILALPLLISWLIGYSTWYIGTIFYGKDHRRKEDSWYGFAQFRQQHQTAALLGTIATVLCFIVPTLIIPTAWLFTISNIFWAIGEHHKKNMPHTDDPDYSTAKQTVYCHLSRVVTTLSFITATAATVLFFFPLSAPILIPVVTAVQITLTIGVFWFLGKYLAGHFEPDVPRQEVVANEEERVDLEETQKPQPKPRNNPEPTCWEGLFKSRNTETKAQELQAQPQP